MVHQVIKNFQKLNCIKWRGVLCDIPIFGNALSSVAKKETDALFLDKQIDRFKKEYITGSGITLRNNK